MPILTADNIDRFNTDGFVIIPKFMPQDMVSAAAARFDLLFRGHFETGLQPDEWNWRDGKSDPDLTRQICNGWKADLAIARLVLNEKVGQICTELMGWRGARINQDNVIAKPPGAKPLGFHQDDAYQQWIVPSSMVTCWMALDQTTAHGGTIEYVKGSNHWPVESEAFEFHAPRDYHEGVKQAAIKRGIEDYEICKIEVNAGDAVFHHGATWHGSGMNSTTNTRRAVVAHCMSSDARFHETNVGAIYGRYKRFGSTEMDESYFPIIYRQDGYRSAFIENYLRGTYLKEAEGKSYNAE